MFISLKYSQNLRKPPTSVLKQVKIFFASTLEFFVSPDSLFNSKCLFLRQLYHKNSLIFICSANKGNSPRGMLLS